MFTTRMSWFFGQEHTLGDTVLVAIVCTAFDQQHLPYLL